MVSDSGKVAGIDDLPPRFLRRGATSNEFGAKHGGQSAVTEEPVATKWVRLLVVPVFLLVPCSDAFAQRIPIIYLWLAGAGLIAPLVAVPFKSGILRLLHIKVAISRLWFLAAAEWVLWFPVAYLMFRSGRPVAVPLVLPIILGLVVWVHKSSVAATSWRSALLLSLPTPVLAIALPFVAFVVAVQFEK
jgi:hypothetical protein